MSKFIVLRGDAAGKYDGWWFDLAEIPERPDLTIVRQSLKFDPTGTFETRDDGAKAEAYRVVPIEEEHHE